jgi:hypothetical protein
VTQFLTDIFDALPPGTLWIVGVGSVVTFLGTLLAIPLVLVRLPEDYFDVRVPRTWMKDHHPALRLVGVVAKNLFGVAFLLAGLAMLLLPGQGLLTILIGVTLIDFPGKQLLESRIVGRPAVLSAVNALRQKFGKPPLVLAPWNRRHAEH